MGSTKIVLLVLCLAVCVGMCRPDPTTASPVPSQQSDSSSFSQWASNKFSHIFGSQKQEEPVLSQTQNFQLGLSSIFGAAPVEAPAPAPFASAPQPSSDAAQQALSYGKDMANGVKDKAEEAYDGAKDKVEGAYNSAKKTVT